MEAVCPERMSGSLRSCAQCPSLYHQSPHNRSAQIGIREKAEADANVISEKEKYLLEYRARVGEDFVSFLVTKTRFQDHAEKEPDKE